MSETYTARAVLTASDRNFTAVFKSALGTAGQLENKFSGGLGMGIAMGIGQKLFTSLTSGLSNIVRGTIAAGSGLESAMKQVQATMRVTESTVDSLNGKPVVIMDALREKAEELGRTTQFSAVQVGQAMNNMAMAGYDVQKIYDNIPTVLNLAAAGGLSLDYATQLVANGMAVMGDRCESAAQMADMLAVTASSAYGSVSEFGEGLLVAGGQAKLCGLELAETYTALGILGDAGMQGSEGGTQLRNALKNLYTPTDKAATVLENLGVVTKDLTTGELLPLQNVLQQLGSALDGMTEADRTQIMSEIFDTRTLRAGNALIEASGDRFSELYAKIAACDGAAMEMANTVNDNLQGDMVKFSSAVEGLQDAIYKSLDGPLRMAVQAGTKGINILTSAAEFLGNKFEKVKPYITAITDEAGRFLETSEGLKAIAGAFGDIFRGAPDPSDLSTASAQAEKFGRSFDGGKLAKFKENLREITGSINEFLTKNKGVITEVIHLLPMLVKGFAALSIAKAVTGKLAPLGRGLQTVSNVFSATAGAFGEGAAVLGKTSASAFGSLGKILGREGGAFDKFGMRAQQALFKVEAATGRFDRNPPKIWEMVNSGKLGSAFGKFGNVATKAIGGMIGGYTKLAGVALRALAPGAMVGVVLAGLGLVYNAFGGEIDQILQLVQAKGPAIITNLANSIVSQIPALIASGSQMVMGLLSTFTALAPSIVTAGANIIASLATGVGNALPTLIPQAVLAVATLVVSLIGNVPKLIAAGIQLLVGLAQGIANSLPILISMAAKAAVSFIQGIGANLPNIIMGGVQILGALITGILSAIPSIIAGAGQIIGAFVTTFFEIDWGAVGLQVITAIKDGIVNGFHAFGDFLTGLFSGTDAGQEAGKEQVASVTTGIEEGKAEAVATTESAVNDIMAPLQNADFGSVTTAWSESITGMADQTTPALAGVSTAFGEMGTELQTVSTETSTQVTTTFNGMVTGITSILTRGKTVATNLGKTTGTGYSGGIRSGTASASAAGTAVKNSGLNGMSGGYSTAYGYGANIGQGLVDGMRSRVSAAWSAANSLAEAADKAIHARAKIGSPSKITIQYGKWIAEGLAKGLTDGTWGVVKQAKNLTKNLFTTMKSGTNSLSTIATKMSSALKKFRDRFTEKSNKDYEWMTSNLTGKLKNMPKKYKDSYSALLKAYKESYNKEMSKLINDVNTKFSKLAKTYQTKYNQIIENRRAFKEKLQEHSLFTADDYGNVSLMDFNAQKKSVAEYKANIDKLKKLLPDNMMEEILGMGMENGLAYTNELLKKSTDWIKDYGKQYTSFMSAGSSTANSYYNQKIKELQTTYTKQLKETYTAAVKDMNNLGQKVMQGLINGMKSKKGALDATGNSLAKVVLDAVKKKFNIHSPSREMEKLGNLAGEGWVLGLEDMTKDSWRAMEEMVNLPKVASTMPRLGSANFTNDQEISEDAEYVIIVKTEIDGREVAQVIAPFSEAIMNRRTIRQNRKQGVI